MPEGAAALLPLDLGIAALTGAGAVAALRERDLAACLDLLFAKGLHGIALNVAEAAKARVPLLRPIPVPLNREDLGSTCARMQPPREASEAPQSIG